MSIETLLQPILDRADAARNEPWVYDEERSWILNADGFTVGVYVDNEDGIFISAARTDVPRLARALLRAIDELESVASMYQVERAKDDLAAIIEGREP
jgi:Holliday junction resolvasome RuvABC ATP-dependent DNA helicase subunit